MKTSIGGKIATIESMGATVSKKYAVDADGTLPASGARIMGVLVEDADSGQSGGVQIDGEAVALSGAAITLTAGIAAVQVDATGRFIPYSSGTKYYARDAASAAGEEIRVFLDTE